MTKLRLFRISAIVFSLALSALPTVSSAAMNPPSAITITNADVNGSSVVLNWKQSNVPATHIYKVEISNLSMPKKDPVVLKTSNFSVKYDGLAVNSKYQVRVQLTFGNFYYPWSQKTVFSTILGAPKALTLGEFTDNSANITWIPVIGAVSYRIFVDGTAVGTTSGSNFRISSLKPDTTYKVSVSAIVGKLESVVSPSINVTTKSATSTIAAAAVVDTITTVATSEITSVSARFTWVTSSNPKTFTVRLLDAAGTKELSTYEVAGELRTFTVTGLAPFSTYQLSVTRNNPDGTSSTSALTTFVTSKNPAISLTATPFSSTSVSLTWVPVAGAAYYEVFRDGAKVGDNLPTTTTSYTVTGLTPGYIYKFVVRVASYDANKNVVFSDSDSGVYGSPLPDAAYAPTVSGVPAITLPYASVPIVGATLSASTGIWSNSQSITSYSYQWQRSVDNATSWLDIPGQTSSQYVVVASDYQYKLRVVVTARNNNGANSSPSVASSAVDALYNVQIPIVRGALIPGQLLETSEGVWSSKYPMTYTYQWYRGASVIDGEQTTAYTLTTADIGYLISVRVQAITSLGSLTVVSAQRSAVTAIANTDLPVVTGVAKTFSTLSTTVGTWIGNPTGTLYQWQRSLDMSTWDSIPGATAPTYTTVLGDAGYYIRSEVYETKTVSAVTYKVSAASLPTAQIANLTVNVSNTVLPAITGSWNVGQILNLSNGSWSTVGTLSYQWQSSSNGSAWSDIAGATSNTYTLTNTEAGLYVRAKVLNVSGGATGFAYSNATAKVGAPYNTALPAITGVAQVGETQTVSSGTWNGTPTYSYQWQSSSDGIAWTNVAGATNSTFVMTFALSNLRIRIVVTAVNAIDTVTAVAPTIIGFAPPRVAVIPVITGTAQSGQSLSTSAGTWPNTSSGYEYQWQRSSDGGVTWVNINSAVSSSYTVVAGDVGYQIRSQVSVRNNTGTSTAYSLPTAVIAP